MNERIFRFLKEEDGPTAVEYAVMLGLIIVLCIGMIQLVGTTTQEIWEDNEEGLTAVYNGTYTAGS